MALHAQDLAHPLMPRSLSPTATANALVVVTAVAVAALNAAEAEVGAEAVATAEAGYGGMLTRATTERNATWIETFTAETIGTDTLVVVQTGALREVI